MRLPLIAPVLLLACSVLANPRVTRSACEETQASYDECIANAHANHRDALGQGDDGKPDFYSRKSCNYIQSAVMECGELLIGDCYDADAVREMRDGQFNTIVASLEQSEEWDSNKCPSVKKWLDGDDEDQEDDNDFDNDGIADDEDNDDDNDGIADDEDNDDDNDGVPDDEDNDDDNDGVPDDEDNDDDSEGVSNDGDNDFDNDGVTNDDDNDDDNDGIADDEDNDDDNDGIADDEDNDDDNDGVPDDEETDDANDDASDDDEDNESGAMEHIASLTLVTLAVALSA